MGQSLTRIFEANVWDGESVYVSISHNRYSTVVNCFLNIAVTIHAATLHGNEKVTRLDRATIYGNIGDFNIRNLWWDRQRKIREEL